MFIRLAEIADYSWLNKHDIHITDHILKRKIEANEVYIAQEGNEIIGWLRYNLFWDNIPFMTMLFILKEYRQKGIGRQLVRYWEERMLELGYKNVLTSTLSNEAGQHFYRKLGYYSYSTKH